MAQWNRQSRVAWLKSTLKNRIAILDGGMGTMIQQAAPSDMTIVRPSLKPFIDPSLVDRQMER